jgi:hypothetical protein
VLDHLGLGVPDLSHAKAYYDKIMPLLGFEPFLPAERQFSYRRTRGKPGPPRRFVIALTRGPSRGARGIGLPAWRGQESSAAGRIIRP